MRLKEIFAGELERFPDPLTWPMWAKDEVLLSTPNPNGCITQRVSVRIGQEKMEKLLKDHNGALDAVARYYDQRDRESLLTAIDALPDVEV